MPPHKAGGGSAARRKADVSVRRAIGLAGPRAEPKAFAIASAFKQALRRDRLGCAKQYDY